MKVSAIIPTHLRPAQLAVAIESVFAQTVRPAELLVVDDAADLATEKVVASLKVNSPVPIRYLVNRKGGVCTSRNLGAGHSTGTWLSMLDDDDVWKADFIKRLSMRLASTKADLAIGGLIQYEAGEEPQPRIQLENLTSRTVLQQAGAVTGSNFMISRTAYFELGGFDPLVPVFNDWDFFIRFIDRDYRYCTVPQPLVEWRHHHGPRISTFNLQRAFGMEAFIERYRTRMAPLVYRELQTTAVGIKRRHEQRKIFRLYLGLKLLRAHGLRVSMRRVFGHAKRKLPWSPDDLLRL